MMNSKVDDRDQRDRPLPTHAVRLRELCQMIGVGRSTVYTLLRKDASFPQGFYPSVRARAWLAADVLAWLETRSNEVVTQAKRAD